MDDKVRHEAEDAYLASQLSQDVRVVPHLKGTRIRAVIVGVIVDWLASAAMELAYFLFFLRETIERYGGIENVPDHVIWQENLLPLGLIGLLATALGGYVAARIARRRQVPHGVVVAVISLLLGFALELAAYGRVRLYGSEVAFLILMIPAGAFGGYVAQRLSKAARPPAPGVPTMPIS